MRALRLASVILALAGIASSSGYAQENKNRTVDQYKCRDVVRESGPDRDIAIAFLHGFLLGKSGSQNFNLDALHQQTKDFIEHCLSKPDDRAVEAMATIKK